MSATAVSPFDSGPRLLPLGLVVLLHAGFLYAAMHGMQKPVTTPVVPREVIATFITPQPEPEPQPQPTPPAPQPVPKPAPKVAQKPTPVVKKPSPPKPTPTPAPAPEPSEKAISTPAPPVAATPAAPEPQAAAAPAAPPAPPAPAAPAPPKTVSGVEYIQPPQPDYPPIAKRMGEEGKVMLRVLVSDRGRPEKVDVQKSSGFARLDEAARQAALRAMFKPHLEDGRPVAVYALIPINFSIQ
ncbi:MAG: energy transducer TonB [Noviherbaspirillum sp.]